MKDYKLFEQTYYASDSLLDLSHNPLGNTDSINVFDTLVGALNPLSSRPYEDTEFLNKKVQAIKEQLLWSIPHWELPAHTIKIATTQEPGAVTVYLALPIKYKSADIDLSILVDLGAFLPASNPPEDYKFNNLIPSQKDFYADYGNIDISAVDEFVSTLKHTVNRKFDPRPLFVKGFKHAGSGASKDCYLHPELPFVLKFGGNPKDEILRARKNPIIHSLYLFPLFWRGGFMIQPKVDRSAEAIQRAMREIKLRLKNQHVDLHEGNVGIFRGRPVLIDF